ncbi:MAG TPA: GAF domain-containing protein, partial [Chloroflexi bacterium]|nr:GAF domain-containing protein [Chloroflexota bacterium]
MRQKRKLRARIIAWFLIPAVIVFVAAAWGLFIAYQQVTENLVIERDRELTALLATQLSAGMAEQANLLREYTGLLADPTRPAYLNGDNPVALRQILMEARGRFDIFNSGVLLINGQGIVVAAEPERPEIIGQNWSDRPYFRQMLRFPATTFSNITPDGPNGEEVIVIAVPIVGQQGQFLGVIAGLLRLDASTANLVYSQIMTPRIGESGSAYVVDGNGRVLFHSNADHIGDDFSEQEAARQAMARQMGAIRTCNLDGREIVAGFAPLPDTPWSLITEESWTDLLNANRNYFLFILILLALGLTIPIIAVIVGVRQITEPVAKLTKAARQVAAGDFGQTIQARTGDEIEDLAEQFNIMSMQLQESYARLERRLAKQAQAEESLLQSKASLERSHRVLADKVAKLEVLHRISIAISSQMETETLLQRLVEQARVLVDAVSCSILLPDEETGELVFRAAADDIIGHRIPPGQGVAFRVLRERAPQIIHQAAAVSNHYAKTGQESGVPTQSLLAAPLLASDRTIGVLEAVNKQEGRFDEEDLELLMTMAGHAAVSIENAQLYDRLQEYTATLEERVAERTAELAVAKERAEEADHLKSAFLTTMSHELRTPLNSIIGFVGIILQGLAGPLNGEQEKQLNMVYGSARHLLDLINDVLDISKIEAGEVKLQRKTFDFSGLIDKALHAMMPIAEKKGLTL